MTRVLFAVLLIAPCASAQTPVEMWVSTEDMTRTLDAAELPWNGNARAADIRVDAGERYQSMLGMGSSLEHATCYNLSQLPEPLRDEVIERIVSPETGMGMNLMRICIGTSDFTGDPWYSYCDTPDGEPDPDLKHFSIEKDRAYVLPILKRALELNPDLLFFASPWSAPGWMKTSGRMTGGSLKPEYYDAYAAYLLKAVAAYEAEGLPIRAITLQNEPQYAPPTYPTSLWSGAEQARFIKESWAPALAAADRALAVWCWDHNFNDLDFPRSVLSDPAAARFVEGTAFHHYEGQPAAMTTLKNEFPEKDIFFTEGSTFGVRGAVKMIEYLRNWARTYNAWVTVLDDEQKPNNGPHSASPTCIVRNRETNTVEYRFDFYMYAQFMRYIQRGAVRIGSGEGTSRFANVAFENPDGAIVCVVANAGGSERAVTIAHNGKAFEAVVPGKAVTTFRWNPVPR
jgi:O-glycosyl hydrolase